MAKLAFLYVLFVSLLVTVAAAETSARPLRQSELLALVAGNALPENIVNEIHTRGVAFRMDASFRAQLTTAGATASILGALDAVKPTAKAADENAKAADENSSDAALLQHITTAAKLIKDKH